MRRARALALAVLVLAGALVPVWAPVVVQAAESGTFSGEVSIQMDAATDGSTSRYDLANASQTDNFSVELTGLEETETESVSGTALGDGDTLPFTVAGTEPARNDEVTFIGVLETRGAFWSGTNATDGDTDAIDVEGNQQPENQTVRFLGRGSTTTNSWSRTGQTDGSTATIDVGGNTQPENQSVTFTGSRSTTSNPESGQLSDGSSSSITVNGNLDPTGPSANNKPELTLTSQTTNKYHCSDACDTYAYARLNGEIGFQNVDAMDSVTINISSGSGAMNVYVVEEAPDGVYGEGTQVKQELSIPDGGNMTIDFGQSFGSGGWVTVEFEDYYGSGSMSIYGEQSASGSGVSSYDGEVKDRKHRAWAHYSPDSVSATVSDGQGTSVDFGPFTGEQSETKEMPVDVDATSLSLSADGKLAADYTLEKTDVTVTEDPSVDIDGDGSSDASYSGLLDDGETVTRSLSGLETGSVDVTTYVTAESVDWTIEADEVTATKDPAVDIGADGTIEASYSGVLKDGETAEVAVSELSTGQNELAFATSSTTGFDWEVTADEQLVTEDPSLDIDGDGTPEASVSGTLAPGETATRSVDLSTGSYDAAVGVRSWGAVDVGVDYTEVTHSKNPRVTVNGYEAGYDGTLGPGENASLNVSTDWLADGENVVEVHVGESLSANAPTARVTMDYYHESATSHSTTYNATAWTEERTINKTFVEDQQNATVELPFHDSVVDITELKTAWNGGNMTRVDSANYEYADGVVTLQLGDVEANETVEVYAAGRRVKVNDGNIAIREPTMPGEKLDTEFEVTAKGDNFWLGVENQRVLRTYNESWSDPSSYSNVEADGTQRLYLPEAANGSTARVEYTPLEVNPERGDVKVRVEDIGSNQFHLDYGRTNGDTVELTWLTAVEDKKYALWSVTHSDTLETTRAGPNGVVFTAGDNPQTLQIIESEDAAESGFGGPFGFGQTLQGGMVLALVAGAVALVYWLQRRYGGPEQTRRDWLVIATTAGAMTLLGMEIVAPGSTSQMMTSGTIPVLGGAVVAILGLYYGVDYLPGGRKLKMGYLGVGIAFVGLLALEVLAPGSVSEPIGPMLADALDPAVRLGGLVAVGLIGYLAYRRLFGGSSDSGSTSSDSGSSVIQVIVQDDDASASTTSSSSGGARDGD